MNIINQVKTTRIYELNGYVMFSYRCLFTKEGKREIANYMKSISGLKLIKTNIKLKKGKKCDISKNISVNPGYPSSFKYSSDNKRIVSVSENGIIKARRRGTATIYIRGIAGSTVTCKIKVR